jgi:lysylphosphatidylglycerol synthetase-like protein (DUF2156 family)
VNFSKRAKIILWQLSFLLLATTWLWAPILNQELSYRSSLISQYETPLQPYSWLFRIGDIMAGLLVTFMALYLIRLKQHKVYSYLLLAIGLGFILDPILSTTCVNTGNVCKEYFSLSFVLHATETIVTSAAIFGLTAYYWWKGRSFISAMFVGFQIAYGLLFLTQWADQGHFNTASQYLYQTVLIVWIAWFIRNILIQDNFKVGKNEEKIVRNTLGTWAFLNGFLAILVSLAHIRVLGHIRGLYFAGDSAWLAQHGVIVGIMMIYLSRHLMRGELRARQIFLIISGLETLKYAVVSLNGWLLAIYLLTFCALFVLRDDFDRGTVPLTFSLRLRDAVFMLSSLLVVVLIFFVLAGGSNERARITTQSIDHFFDYTLNSTVASKTHLKTVLLVHTETAFVLTGALAISWILFRPYKKPLVTSRGVGDAKEILKKYSDSSEDYFKAWPYDKNYYFSNAKNGFIAYREVGPVSFALANPISAGGKKAKLLRDFVDHNKANRLRTCFLMVTDENKELYKKHGLEIMQIGASAEVEIDKFLEKTARDKWWRWKKNSALKNGFLYSVSMPPHSGVFLQQLKAVSDEWLKMGGHLERGFALGYFDEEYMQECMVHYLHNEQGKILAFTNQLPQFKDAALVTVDLLRYLPEAQNAMPFLLLNTIGRAKQEGYKVFDLGFVPFAQAKDPVLNIVKTLSTGRFSAKGLEQFKNKFDPSWKPNYIAYDGDFGDLALIAINLERAMDIKQP